MHLADTTIIAIIMVCGYLTAISIGCAALVTILGLTIVYSWWRSLQVTRDSLPELLQSEIHKLASKCIQPYRELLDESGRATAEPNVPSKEIDLETEYEAWSQLP